ncbi:MAG TPA: hypothetical protein VF473_11315 [Cyclobacteriaceae bacterium]
MKTIFILNNDSSQQGEVKQHLGAMGFSVQGFRTAAEFEGVTEKPFMIILDE